ncbi:hypothetical protein LOZ80_32040 [Paenibacillus sp. HWE-109]|uniref:hypothetical protein n=1 Tax=Paenibacillus sp. HWE-109 TaxID=1306526 RepID=UPI001EDE8EA0|nr:hypothetical protein [Paenibacillus sp. HWE-109]UKS26129.1 hypothetical protein LOZ80_32040 [Paenibacillus sp. HWE-109]
MVQKGSKKLLATILLGSAVALIPIATANAAEVAVSWNTDNVIITNNVGKPDIVKVGGLVEGAIVKVYDKATGGVLLGSGTVAKGSTEALVSIANLGAASGKVYISVVLETAATETSFSAEAASDAPVADNITITNNAGLTDSVKVTGLAVGDIVKVYKKGAATVLGTSTVATGKTEAIVSVPQLGTAAGDIEVTITSTGKLESTKVEKAYDAESKTNALDETSAAATNNVGKADTVAFTGLTAGTIIKIYDKPLSDTTKKQLGTATVAAGATTASITIAQLGTASGTVFVTATEAGKTESDALEVSYTAEAVSTAPDAANITIVNNAVVADSVKVTGLAVGDIVKVYKKGVATVLATSTAVATGKTEAIVSVPQLGTAAGDIEVTVTSTGKLESTKVEKAFDAEGQTDALVEANVTATNNVGKSDTVDFKGLTAGTIVKVYDKALSDTTKKQIGMVTVAANATTASVSITQLGATSGKVYVTATVAGKTESEGLEVSYTAESVSTAPDAANITIVNNAVVADSVKVTGLAVGDIVKVYKKGVATVLATSTAVATGKTEAIVSVPQLGTAAGDIEVTVTSTGKLESTKVEKAFDAEGQTDALVEANVTATNNVGKADTVDFTGLTAGTIVKVYDKALSDTTKKQIGTATVAANATTASASITQLGATSGKVYVTATVAGKTESEGLEVSYTAESVSTAPDAANITIVNNAVVADSVKVTGLAVGDIVKVYKKGVATVLSTATVATGKTEAIVSVPQLGTAAGDIEVTVTSTGKLESTKVEKAFDAEGQTDALVEANVTATNNVGKADTVDFTGLTAGTIVKVYDKALSDTTKKQIGTATVAAGATTASVSIAQLGATSGKVYVTATVAGKTESEGLEVSYTAESVSTAPDAANITIVNNAVVADSVKVTGLAVGDIVKVYKKGVATVLSTATVATGKTEAIVSVSQLGTAAGDIEVTVTSTGKLESTKVEKAFDAEGQTDALVEANVKATNNVGKADTVDFTGLTAGTIVKVYDKALSDTTKKQIGTATVAANATTASASIAQLGATSGKVYVTATVAGKTESEGLEVSYTAESVSTAPDAANITIVNNAVVADSVKVTGLAVGDIVKVYKKGVATVLSTATVATGKTEAIVSVPQLGTAAGDIEVTVTSTGKLESTKVEKAFDAEGQTDALVEANVTATNNVGKADTVDFTGLTAGTIVKVYDKALSDTTKKQIGTATVAANATTASASIAQLGATSGKVYVTATVAGKTESEGLEVSYTAESVSTAPDAANITIVNNAVVADSVKVTGLAVGDIVKVYKKGVATVLSTATVATGKTEAIVSVSQLGTAAGDIEVTVTSTGKLESTKVEKAFDAEGQTDALVEANVTATNNVGKPDTVDFKGLTAGTIVKVYDKALSDTTKKQIGTVTVAANATTASVSITQLGATSGKVYVTATVAGKTESEGLEVSYTAESVSTAPDAANITIVNNAVVADSVKVTGLAVGDIVKVYKKGVATVLATSTVATGKTEAIVSVPQLGTAAGDIEVTVTSTGKLESTKVEKAFDAEGQSDALVEANVTATNNVGKPDTVDFKGLTAGTIVKVYDKALSDTTKKQIGTATVAAGATTASVSITQLGATSGKVYVTATVAGKTESEGLEVSYTAESVSTAPDAANITIVNNAVVADSVKVTGLAVGDIVKVYKKGVATVLATSTAVATGKTEAIVSVPQLGTAAGDIEVTVTSTGKLESTKVEKAFDAEGQSDALVEANVTATNNVGKADTVAFTGLTAGTIVKVYDKALSDTTKKQIGTATVAAGATTASVSITQLGATSGKVYVTATVAGKTESEGLEVSYTAESVSTAPDAANITIVNNAVIADSVKVTGLAVGDIVKVYKKGVATVLATSTAVATGKTEAIVSVPQLGTAAGDIEVTVTSTGKLESTKVEKAFEAEGQADTVVEANVTVTNNVGKADTVAFTGLTAGTIVKVYDKALSDTTKKQIGTATVAAGATTASVSIPQLGATSGKVYVTATVAGKTESAGLEVSYTAEAVSTAPDAASITIVNNAVIPDSVKVTGLAAGDIVKVYKKGEATVLATSTAVATGKTEAIVSIPQLGAVAGDIEVTVTSTGKLESTKVEKAFDAEAKTATLDASKITVLNKVGNADSVTVTGLTTGTVVKVYTKALAGTQIGVATVLAGKTDVTLNVSNLGFSAGKVYVTNAEVGKLESDTVEVDYAAE